MSAPVQNDVCLNDPQLYAPRWARERSLPETGQPQLINSPPVASAFEGMVGTAPSVKPSNGFPPRLPRGIGGPNISAPPDRMEQPEFGGDVAVRALRRRLAMKPRMVPQPPILRSRPTGLPWITRLGLIFLAAGIAAFSVTYLGSAQRYDVLAFITAPKGDRVSVAMAQDPARLVVEPGSAGANEPLPLRVSLRGTSGGEFLQVAGLAPGTRLTSGTPVGSKGWRFPASEAPAVLAYAPHDYVGAMDAAIDLRSPGDRLLDSQVVHLEWIAKTPDAMPTPVVAIPATRQLDPDEIARLLQKSEQYLNTGDIAAARLMLRRAADAGNAEAAFRMGATFDPAVLRQMGVQGFMPNPEQARSWYKKAAELGSSEASRRVGRLQQAER